MSFHPCTPSERGKVIGAALKREASGAPLCSAGNQLHARSNRTAPCTVNRLTVHWSWAKNAWDVVRLLVCHGAMRYPTVAVPFGLAADLSASLIV